MAERRRRPRTAIATSTTAQESPKAISFGKPPGDSRWTRAWSRLTRRGNGLRPQKWRNGLSKSRRTAPATAASVAGQLSIDPLLRLPMRPRRGPAGRPPRVSKEQLPAVRGARVATPVGHHVKHQVRSDPDHECRHRMPLQEATDHDTGEHMIGHEHGGSPGGRGRHVGPDGSSNGHGGNNWRCICVGPSGRG